MLDGLFEDGVLSAWAPLSGALVGLHPAERRWAASAAEARRAEIATGRRLARELLGRLGIEGHALLADASRAPRWPQGVVGAIAHKRDGGDGGDGRDAVCAVAVARSADGIAGLGLDVEVARPLPEPLWRRAFTDGERAWLAGRDAAERGRLARVLWTAKECAFKAAAPCRGGPSAPAATEVELEPETGRFRARAGRGFALCGRFRAGDAWILAGAVRRAG